MSVYVALLRGINVGGHRLIKMADLKQACEAWGLSQVQTYIQSGNVLFASAESEAVLRNRLEQGIAERFGFTVPVVLRTAAEVDRLLTDSPFGAADGGALFLGLMPEVPPQENVARLQTYDAGVDEFRVIGRDIYLLLRQSVRDSKLTNTFLEKKLGVPVTVRNWQTMAKLAQLSRAME